MVIRQAPTPAAEADDANAITPRAAAANTVDFNNFVLVTIFLPVEPFRMPATGIYGASYEISPSVDAPSTDTRPKALSIIKSLLFIIDSLASFTHSGPKALRGNDGRN
ncbi:hypothetical protein MesoLj113b_50620 [Mesorhizobium sp. 113-3-3]|nr:hypothetical protein MesoLj113b_50620 [Mesorhizobium sp. 113-3-3]